MGTHEEILRAASVLFTLPAMVGVDMLAAGLAVFLTVTGLFLFLTSCRSVSLMLLLEREQREMREMRPVRCARCACVGPGSVAVVVGNRAASGNLRIWHDMEFFKSILKRTTLKAAMSLLPAH